MVAFSRWALLLAAMLPSCGVSVLISSEHVKSFKPWVFLARFCFQPLSRDSREHEGNTVIKVSFRNTSRLSLLGYPADDTSSSINDEAVSCGARMAAAQEVVPLWESDFAAPQAYVQDAVAASDGMVHAAVRILFGTSRAKFYYFALANCEADCLGPDCWQGGVDAFVEMEMTNGGSHFSADEMGLLGINATFVFLYAVLVASVTMMHRLAKRRKLLNPTTETFAKVVYLSALSVLLEMVHLVRLKNTGLGLPELKNVAALVRIVADVLYVLVCVLFAKGWNVVRRSLTSRSQVRLTAFASFYLALSLCAEAWAIWGHAPQDTLYKYETVPGGLLVALRCAAFLWVAWATHTTTRNFFMMTRFFHKFLFLASVWILSLPLIFLLALALDPYLRARIVYVVDLSLLFLTQSALTYMWWPTRDNGRFPFKPVLRFGTANVLPSQFNDLPNRDDIESARDVAAIISGHTQEMLRLLGQAPILSFKQLRAQREPVFLSSDDTSAG